LEYVQELARELDRPTAVYTFDPAPRDVLRPDNDIPRIQLLEDKTRKLHQVGVDQVVIEKFTLEFAQQEAEWFAREIIARRLGASALVVGWDFYFGRNRSGNCQDLSAWLDIPVHSFAAYKEDGQIISSSRVRQAVRAGRVSEASVLLEGPHEVVGDVISGDGRGRSMGYPTANIRPLTKLIPADGVYAVEFYRADGARYNGVANIGVRPTFGTGEQQIEVHLFDFDGDLYGERVRVSWIQRLRGEQHFANPAELMERIRLDSQLAREILAGRS
jgi:riboflavin kinase/FMN adenylyltransferase